MSKKRLVKNYDALPEDILQAVKLKYPTGYEQHLITYRDKDNKIVSALPFETDEIYYLIRMTVQEAKRLVRDADDLDDDSLLRAAATDIGDLDVENEFDGDGEDDDDMSNDDDESDHIIVTRRRNSDEDDMDDIADTSSDY